MKRYSPLLLILVLAGALAASQTASAASTTPAAPTFPQLALQNTPQQEEAEEEEAEAEEFELEACEATAGEFEFEEEEFEEVEEFELEEECGEEETKGKNSTFVTAPAACRVRRAESSITTLPGSDEVQLTVHYLTYAPATITVSLKLKDGKGSVTIEHTTRHLGTKGVLHLTTKLSDTVMERAAKAKEFDVALRAANTPGYCGGLLEQQLESKHPVGNARVYTGSAKG